MESEILGLDGKSKGKIKLPDHFKEEFRPDLIRRAVLAEQSWRFTPYGSDPKAGGRSSAKFCGRRDVYGHYYGYAMSRVPRVRIQGRPVGAARNVPFAVKGRRAHPPQVNRKLRENINKKERKKAIRCAISATALIDTVKERGHRFEGKVPLVVDDKLQSINKTSKVKQVLVKIGLIAELERASEKKVRAGRGKMRGRKYKRKVGPLIVVGEDKGILKAANNIAGVEAVTVNKLTCEVLAPGTHPGRLTIWTPDAINKLQGLYR
jgi:large subunit ribosomal protein L4e